MYKLSMVKLLERYQLVITKILSWEMGNIIVHCVYDHCTHATVSEAFPWPCIGGKGGGGGRVVDVD